MISTNCTSCSYTLLLIAPYYHYHHHHRLNGRVNLIKKRTNGVIIRCSMVEPSSNDNNNNNLNDNFTKRIEKAWLISKQPRPVACSSCESSGHVECKWCGGTGFFILGDNMLCEVPSRNSSCVICAGKYITKECWDILILIEVSSYQEIPMHIMEYILKQGSTCCGDCKGTGFRAKWLEQPPIQK